MIEETSGAKPATQPAKSIGRRKFLQSLFGGIGGGTVAEEQVAQAKSAPSKPERHTISFFWTNVTNGQIGFPTGTVIPGGLPGSIMKLVSAAALRESGLYAKDETIECRGIVQIHNQTYSCLYPHGKVDLTEAIGLSCNVFFATASQKLNAATFVDYAQRFGLNTPIEGHGALSFPKPGGLRGSNADYALGLSDDLQPNALQILRMTAAIALQGHVPPMHNTGMSEHSESKPFDIELSPATWNVLQQGMRICDRKGTAKTLDPSDKLKLAAKTGTAPHGKSFQSWICGYFPFNAPKYAFCLRSSGGTSTERAVPEARKWLFSAEWT